MTESTSADNLTQSQQLEMADALQRHGWLLYSPEDLKRERQFAQRMYGTLSVCSADAEGGDKQALFRVLQHLRGSLQRPISSHFPDATREFLVRLIDRAIAPAMRVGANGHRVFEKIEFGLKRPRGGQKQSRSRDLERYALAIASIPDMQADERLEAVEVHRKFLGLSEETIDERVYRDLIKRARARERTRQSADVSARHRFPTDIE